MQWQWYSKTTFVAVNLSPVPVVVSRLKYSKTTFVTVNRAHHFFCSKNDVNSKTTFVTVNPISGWIIYKL